jgi:hemerythrin superfamily protein
MHWQVATEWLHQLLADQVEHRRAGANLLTFVTTWRPLMPAKKKSSSKAKVARKPKDAIGLLRADHATVEELFEKFEKTRDDSKKLQIAQRVCMELKIHAAIEEEIFYPAVREVLPKEEDLLDEAEVEHASAKDLIAQIESGSPSDEKWEAKVTVLGEYIKHHVKEEQGEMFAKVKKTKLDLRALGEQLLARKEELAATATSELK